jgi:hypothetical protein
MQAFKIRHYLYGRGEELLGLNRSRVKQSISKHLLNRSTKTRGSFDLSQLVPYNGRGRVQRTRLPKELGLNEVHPARAGLSLAALAALGIGAPLAIGTDAGREYWDSAIDSTAEGLGTLAGG